MRFTDADGINEHLRGAINSKDHFIFITDSEATHEQLGVVAVGLVARGVPDAMLGYGIFEVFDSTNGSDLAFVLQIIGVHETRTGQDIFAVSNEPQRLGILLKKIRDGKAYEPSPGTN